MEKNNACLFSVCVTDLPGQRGDFLVESGFGFFFFFFYLQTKMRSVTSFVSPLWLQTSWAGGAL